MTPAIATTISGWLALMGLWVLFFWLYRDYRVDVFRQRLFRLRDGLFDYAAAEHIPFAHPSYRGLRNFFNGLIRFGDRLGLTWILAAALMRVIHPMPEEDAHYTREQQQIFENAPAESREYFRNVHEIALLLAFEQILLTSLVIWLLVIPVVATLAIRWLWREGARMLVRYLPGRRLIDREATELGLIA